MAKKPKRPRDPNQLAKLITEIATGEAEDIHPPAVDEALQADGRKGGQTRAANLSPERRSEIARKAAASRWSKS